MKKIIFLTVFGLIALNSSHGLADETDDFLLEFGNKSDATFLKELREWHNRLKAIADFGRAYIGCSSRTHSGPVTFNRDFEACWSGHDRARSCANRCNSSYKVYGYYAPSAVGPGAIQYVIFCLCDNVRHDYALYPVPTGVVLQE